MARREKRPRRKPGTGTIRYKASRAEPWEAAFPIGHRQHRYEYFQSYEAAAAHLDRLTAERDSIEQPRNVAGGSQRVDQFLAAWLKTKEARVRHKTYLSYQYYCELACGDGGLRALRLDQVTRERADEMLLYFYRRGFQNVAQLRACMLQAFGYAFEEEYIKKNPFAKSEAPEVTRRPGVALTFAQRAHLLECAATDDKLKRDAVLVPLGPLWHIYSRLGLRKGEGIGLLWGKSGIDLDAGTLMVSRQITAAGGVQYISDPKTKRGRRTLPIPPDLLDLLKRHKDEQIKRASADPEWKTHGLVFPGAHGEPIRYWYISSRWRHLRARAGFPQMNIHDLRHTALTLLELGGTPRNVVQAIAGHSSQAITGMYTEHVDFESMRRAVGA